MDYIQQPFKLHLLIYLLEFLCHRHQFTINSIYVHNTEKKLFPFQTLKHNLLEKDSKAPEYGQIAWIYKNGRTVLLPGKQGNSQIDTYMSCNANYAKASIEVHHSHSKVRTGDICTVCHQKSVSVLFVIGSF